MTASLMLPIPTTDQQTSAKQLATRLDAHDLKHGAVLKFSDDQEIEIPEVFLRLLKLAAQAMMRGKGIRAIPVSDKVTTQMAAQVMGCSRQHVVNLIENGALKCSKIGTHRRIAFQDLLSFMDAEDKERDEIMADIIDATTEMGGYES